MIRFISLLLLGLLSLSTYGQNSEEPADNWTEINLAVTDDQVIPAYDDFARATDALVVSARAFCLSPAPEFLETFRSDFHTSMDAWQQIQHIQFGPATYFNWNFRLQYWPDENGTGARQLDALIASDNEDALIMENFARESVGVQGFPALERLLFDEASLQQLTDDSFRCRVAQTIATNINEMATGIYTRWVDEFRNTIANADERGFFESAEDATIDFMKAQVEPIRRIQQQKIEDVLGESAGRERVRRAESWRSGRSLRNIRFNVAALENLFNGSGETSEQLNNVLYEADISAINDSFEALNAALTILPDSMGEVLEQESGREQLLDLAAKLDALYESLEAALKNTDLYLGFNSLDGD